MSKIEYFCEDCEGLFESKDIKWVREVYSDVPGAWELIPVCPCCKDGGSIQDAEHCKFCEEAYIPSPKAVPGYCPSCSAEFRRQIRRICNDTESIFGRADAIDCMLEVWKLDEYSVVDDD